jgi:hypothetical protein
MADLETVAARGWRATIVEVKRMTCGLYLRKSTTKRKNPKKQRERQAAWLKGKPKTKKVGTQSPSLLTAEKGKVQSDKKPESRVKHALEGKM